MSQAFNAVFSSGVTNHEQSIMCRSSSTTGPSPHRWFPAALGWCVELQPNRQWTKGGDRLADPSEEGRALLTPEERAYKVVVRGYVQYVNHLRLQIVQFHICRTKKKKKRKKHTHGILLKQLASRYYCYCFICTQIRLDLKGTISHQCKHTVVQ